MKELFIKSNPIQKLNLKIQCKSENQIFSKYKFLSLLLGYIFM